MTVQPDHLLRCTITSYHVDLKAGEVVETVREATTGYHVSDGWLYLHNSCASVDLELVLKHAHEGRDWGAQAGSPPVYHTCIGDPARPRDCCGPTCEAGWGGRNYSKIYVTAGALLELEQALTIHEKERAS
jgi:hypothetical protein